MSLSDAEKQQIADALMMVGFAMTDEPPRGKGYGYFDYVKPENIDDLAKVLRDLPPAIRAKLLPPDDSGS